MVILIAGGGYMERNINEIENGSMTVNLEDVVALGKQMERMRDGKDLQEDGRIVDPIQHNVGDIDKES